MPPTPDNRFDVRMMDSIADVERREWDRLYGNLCENYDYFLACEQAGAKSFQYGAIAVFEGNRLVAGVPTFQTTLSLQALTDGLLKKFISLMQNILPHLSRIRVLGMGSPHVDELPLVFDKLLSNANRLEIVEAIDQFLQSQLNTKRADIILWKNLDSAQFKRFGNVLRSSHCAPISGLPVAVLDIPATEEAYIQGLSANMRSNIRRKLKKAADVDVEILHDTGGLDDELFALREQTRARATTDYDVFEEISPDYIASVLRQHPNSSQLILYRHEKQLVGFALVLLEPNQLKEKYTGLRYPEALEHGVFFLNWMTIVRICQEEKIPRFRAGETTYLTKTRLGCELENSWLFVKHRQPLINWLLGYFSGWFDLDLTDPDLKGLGPDAPYRDS